MAAALFGTMTYYYLGRSEGLKVVFRDGRASNKAEMVLEIVLRALEPARRASELVGTASE